ncbi:XdhC family protein [uncultured Adlercreutzia sp.]|uniref:XdhC family protein n=1 Tax=uncultured Adlercreutzia sp. TaxID=875803 RepID=UPI002675F1FB|nr:XdhC/CoxI family protein [uncultured Adlercreutzia sp.]
MREIRDDVRRWLAAGEAVALAQVTKTWGSSPRVPGACMAVTADGRIAGSVSGGCIEGAIAQVALDCLDGHLSSLEKFHASTRRAQEVGLSCGGNIEVFVSPLDEALFACEDALIAADADYVRVTAVEETAAAAESEVADMPPAAADMSAPDTEPSLGAVRDADPSPVPADISESGAPFVGLSFLVADRAAAEAALASLDSAQAAGLTLADVPESADMALITPADAGDTGTLAPVAAAVAARPLATSTGHVVEGGLDWFFARMLSKPQLVCIGGVHIAVRLCEIAHVLGYRTVVIDPRGIFATDERFPAVDELVHAWPQEAFRNIPLTASTAVCALTHDPKIDVPALLAALDSPAFYIGSLGRSTTQWARWRSLKEEGATDADIDRIFGPIGLDLRGREPAEIALSVMAEITAVRHASPYELSTMLQSALKVEAEKK